MSVPDTTASAPPDLSACDREPIHIPGAIQPYGAMLVLDPAARTVVQVSANVAEMLGQGPDALLGRPLAESLPQLDPVLAGLVVEPGRHAVLTVSPKVTGLPVHTHLVLHASDGQLVLELEAASERGPATEQPYLLVRDFIEGLHRTASVEGLCALAAREVRRLTGFDRALVYRFDADFHGTVVAEDGNGTLPSYLGLRFPASDIPAQARELYRRNRSRLIADADYVPVPVLPAANPVTGKPVDLSLSVLRAVSPVHLEYMRNMGTWASMSYSIVQDGKLWGLISCHNAAPSRAPFHVRRACEFLATVLALQLSATERAADMEHGMRLRTIGAALLGRMASEERYVDGLLKAPDLLLGMTDSGGAAIISGERVWLVGATPGEEQVRALVEWLPRHPADEAFVTDRLPQVYPPSEAYKDVASGLLAIAVSQIHQDYVLWFRPEVVRTVDWGGDPRKPAGAPKAGRIHPRKSFDVWKETVRLRSLPWRGEEVAGAKALRTAVVDVVLRKAEELAALAEELQRSNKELEAFSYSVSHDLRAPFRHIVGFAELLKDKEGTALSDRGRRYIETIIESAKGAGTLVDNLLSFSQLGRASLRPIPTAMNQLVAEVRRRLEPDLAGRDIRWEVGSLGLVDADPAMLRLALENLLSNAAKYSRGRAPATIAITREDREGEAVFAVRDNGVGFDMSYVHKLFGVFQRLHRMEEFEGTGIGLANVRRIVERHGGRTWAEGATDQGACFYFSLPNRQSQG